MYFFRTEGNKLCNYNSYQTNLDLRGFDIYKSKGIDRQTDGRGGLINSIDFQ